MAGNPFGAELDTLTNEIFDLQGKIAAASGSEADALRKELSAKIQAAAKVDAMSEDWRMGRLTQAVDALKAMAVSELARQARVAERLRRILVGQGISLPAPVQQPPATETEPTVPETVPPIPVVPPAARQMIAASPTSPHGSHRSVKITSQDFDALSRVAQSEVGHFAKHGPDQLSGGVRAVVETILNRVAHKGYPDTISDVANQAFQFSAINTLGSWTLLPEARIPIQNIVRTYLDERVGGQTGMLGGATHFLNPHLSSANALTQWGNHVVRNAVAVFGDDSKGDVHFHGFAPGTSLPDGYAIHFGSWSPVFNGRGEAQDSPAQQSIRQGLLTTLAAESALFKHGKLKEDHDDVWQRIGAYWASLGLPFDGRSKVELANGKLTNPAWSSVFISWSIQQQGIGPDRFVGAQGHWSYVRDAIESKLPNPLYEAMDPSTYAPKPGDIVHYGREWAAQFDLAAAKTHVLADGFYPSHSDFVTAVDASAGEITTIGGNVTNSVGTKTPAINTAGLLQPRKVGSAKLPWITVLRLKG